MFDFLKKLKCKLKSCCGSSIQCGEEAIRKDLEKQIEQDIICKLKMKN